MTKKRDNDYNIPPRFCLKTGDLALIFGVFFLQDTERHMLKVIEKLGNPMADQRLFERHFM